MKPALTLLQGGRTEALADLRRFLARMEGFRPGTQALPLGLPALDRFLPQEGLAFGVLHEVAPDKPDDMPAAFGFLLAVLSRLPSEGPLILVLPARDEGLGGVPHGHGLNGFGIDPARLLLVETGQEKQTLWAIEEALRSGLPLAVAGLTGKGLTLKASQRLQLAAEASGAFLMLLRPPGAWAANAAATRWIVRAAPSARDRFGLLAGWRWRVSLMRSRNGRSGEWLVEYDHAAHRFSLAAPLADPALSGAAGKKSIA
ncbi:MAG: ImuA family protein [Parvibaculaceae bacterium]